MFITSLLFSFVIVLKGFFSSLSLPLFSHGVMMASFFFNNISSKFFFKTADWISKRMWFVAHSARLKSISWPVPLICLFYFQSLLVWYFSGYFNDFFFEYMMQQIINEYLLKSNHIIFKICILGIIVVMFNLGIKICHYKLFSFYIVRIIVLFMFTSIIIFVLLSPIKWLA